MLDLAQLLEQLALEGRLRVQFNPCLRWNSSSAVLVADQKSNRCFDKRKSTGRIDGIVALAMALGLLFDEAEATEDLDAFIKSPLIV